MHKNSIKLMVSLIVVVFFAMVGCCFSKLSIEYGTGIIIASVFMGCTYLIDFITCEIYKNLQK